MLDELNAGGLTAVAPHLPPEVVDGSDEAQLLAWAGNGCAAAIEQLGSDAKKAGFLLGPQHHRQSRGTEEVVQNAFFKVFLRLAAFRGHSRLYTWLVRIALNEAAQQNRLGSSYGTRNSY